MLQLESHIKGFDYKVGFPMQALFAHLFELSRGLLASTTSA